MSDESDQALRGVRVLVVEDEPLVAMLLEDMLGDLGCTVTATASTVAEAAVNLGSQSSAPGAEALAARGLPFVFATGYGESGVPECHRGRPTLQKPFGMNDVATALARAVGR